MPLQKSKVTTPSWAIELRSILTAKCSEPKGEGWMTTDEVCTQLNIARGTALRYLRQGIALGKLERFIGTHDFGGLIRRQAWYRPKTAAGGNRGTSSSKAK